MNHNKQMDVSSTAASDQMTSDVSLPLEADSGPANAAIIVVVVVVVIIDSDGRKTDDLLHQR